MAIRTIRTDKDPILRKQSREVDEINDRILTLLDDMDETMRQAEGVGLAAPQIGVLKRVIVIDIGEGLIEMINPVIIEKDGEQCGPEGCLSIPEQSGIVIRPHRVKVRALNRYNEEYEMEAEDFLARAICHEIDHLNGVLFTDIMLSEEEAESYERVISESNSNEGKKA
ncbi:peptide deformylase [Tindallia californiensis]|uniref:Peptide deformylase n=1 Tax=Tindallia californiensis TaxID=159292 RepID=A0A1H3NUS9_9FIRM|nr:peptide deformylase [Tindallia californiensis]SDY92686.1 peptide deformylase [Tindallia californiensis]